MDGVVSRPYSPRCAVRYFVRCNACSARSEKSVTCKGTTKTKGGTTLLIASWPGSSVEVVIFARANFPRFPQRQLGVTHRHPQLRGRLRGRRGILRTWMRNPQARSRISACGGAAGAGAGRDRSRNSSEAESGAGVAGATSWANLTEDPTALIRRNSIYPPLQF